MDRAALPVTLISGVVALCDIPLPPPVWVGVLSFIFLCEVFTQDKAQAAPARGFHE